MTIYISFFICIIGLVVYAISNNAKVMELAIRAYFAGLLVFLFEIGSHVASLGR